MGSNAVGGDRRSNTRWLIIGLVFVGLAINYLDRASLAVALPFMGEDFQLSATQQGLIFAAFFWSYDFCQLAAGWYVDKVGPRRSFALAALWWSLFTMLTALTRGFWSLFAVRFLLGAGESPAPSSSAKVVATWFPRKERALATSIWDSGSRVGGLIALPIVTAVIALTSWHGVFVLLGVLGVAWAAAWWRFYRAPREHHRANAEEVDYIERGGARTAAFDDEQAVAIKWRSLFRYRTVWAMMIGFFCLNSAIYFFITFFPSYLVEERGFDLLELGFFGAIPGLCAVVFGWLGGFLADRAVAAGRSVTVVRKTVIVGGLVGGSTIMFAALVPEAWMALTLLSFAYASLSIAGTGIWSLPGDVAPSSRHVGSIGGLQNFASNFAGILTPLLVGFLVDTTGSFVLPLVIIGTVALAGAANYLFLIRKVEPLRVPDATPGGVRA
ncbi:MFS transporter [Saccharopolyspora sp. K220]|uniref:MFS transporter n=1 Tax=Saccharopolyspora soli TaxID=2926618 RepID=UPI001F561FD4|nr:MFS transporter [Saccharopolyspora soli]MCI2416345.1 MFS transporter [Saccharopolyspora soli]